jgi:hypothetical protein
VGKLQIAAARGLGGLGATEGPAITCSWTTAGQIPQLLPWLAILALLALKPNRGWGVWWIWLPLAALVGGRHWLLLALHDVPNAGSSTPVELLLEVPLALAFGLAALWLLACYFRGQHRFLAFLGSLAVLLASAGFSFVARAGWGVATEPLASVIDPRHCAATASMGLMAVPVLFPLVLLAVVVSGALALCALACRGRYRPIGLWLWLFLSLLGGWITVSALLYVLCHAALPGLVGYGPFLALGLLMLAVTCATLLPFLILSAVAPLFHQRLKALLVARPELLLAVDTSAERSEGSATKGIRASRIRQGRAGW